MDRTQTSAARRWTADDYFAFGESKLELWDGWPTGPKVYERRLGPFNRFVVEARLIRRLGDAVGPGGGLVGPGAAVATAERALQPPDIAFYRMDRLPPPEAWEGLAEVAPDLAVEVLGPTDDAEVVAEDAAAYLEAGVRLLWVVDPRRRSVTVYQPDLTARVLVVGDVLDGGEVLPEFRLPLAELFA